MLEARKRRRREAAKVGPVRAVPQAHKLTRDPRPGARLQRGPLERGSVIEYIEYADSAWCRRRFARHTFPLKFFAPDQLCQYYASVSSASPALDVGALVAALASLPNQPDPESFSFRHVTSWDVEVAMTRCRSSSCGSDGVSARMLRLASPALYSHLAELFNLSFDAGVFPSEWKHASIVALSKVPSPATPSDTRPISLLPEMSKVLERLAHAQLTDFLEQRNLLDARSMDSGQGTRPKRPFLNSPKLCETLLRSRTQTTAQTNAKLFFPFENNEVRLQIDFYLHMKLLQDCLLCRIATKRLQELPGSRQQLVLCALRRRNKIGEGRAGSGVRPKQPPEHPHQAPVTPKRPMRSIGTADQGQRTSEGRCAVRSDAYTTQSPPIVRRRRGRGEFISYISIFGRVELVSDSAAEMLEARKRRRREAAKVGPVRAVPQAHKLTRDPRPGARLQRGPLERGSVIEYIEYAVGNFRHKSVDCRLMIAEMRARV
ncbi:unnamed protein product [Trichogramma brassicae]|uniref:Uncharacterized protein n=1 Tax=Trichogramma brassicae TaxID=86971 RepID=A0A6H5IHB6_9HYME|nr:unnamed protein product [Trichogramma brassicae]